jgi:rSAM/selenodomain-associated transferase 2/rSAM/selenodomain-associated transferase 1
MRLSIIIPALNEEAAIAATLLPLQALRARRHEVFVVDGGSTDATREVAIPLSDRVIAGPRGRAAQMNTGAKVAGGDMLVFLHADSAFDVGHATALLAAWPDAGWRWGRFDVAIAGRPPILKLVAAMMNLRSRLTGIATGDQGIFVDAALFRSIGGFPDQPLMEDIEISRRLKRAGGSPLALRHRIVTSGRRWEKHGPWRTIAAMWKLRFDYWRGVDPKLLAARYRPHVATPVPTLQIFAREPLPGAVKTRLAQAIGARRATQVYAQLAERTLALAATARAQAIVGHVELWCAGDGATPVCAQWAQQFGFALHAQQGEDLGDRMRNALESALARGERAILIGTDCPLLDTSALAQATAALADHDAVLIPAEDGGYVAIGLARPVAAFDGIAWGTPEVAAMTRTRLAAANIRWCELPALWDVDNASDLARWESMATIEASAR